MALQPGDALGAYTIRSLVGAGGMGEVYRAHDTRLDRLVAIKVLRQELTDDASKARFFRESRMVARLRHPNVVAVFDVGEHGGLPFLVMELVDGPSLAVLIRERRPVTLGTKLQYTIDVCDGLAHAHERGIVHRDVKPANVLVDEGRARLADFGVAWEEGRSITSVGGSPNYFAPEQLAGLGDHRSDLFSLGATFYELITGAKAFPGSIADGVLYRIMHDPAPALPLDLGGAGLAGVVSRALEKDPGARFQSAAEFKAAVARVLGTGQPVAGVSVPRADAAESDVVRFRRRLLESAAPAEIKRLRYEVDQYLAGQPYDVDGRMLSDEIDRALLSPVAASMPRAASAGSWRRPAALTSTIAVALIAVSTFVMMRDRVPESASPPRDSAPQMSVVPPPAGRTGIPDVGSSEGKATSRPAPPTRRQGAPSGRAGKTMESPVLPNGPPTSVSPPPPRPSVESPPPLPRLEPPPPSPVTTEPTPQSIPTLSASDRDAIREVIARYESAHNRRDASSVASVHPGVDARVLADTFDQYRTLQFSVSIRAITVSGDTGEAVVEAVIERTAELKTGASQSTRSPVNIRLRKEQAPVLGFGGATWRIQEVRALLPPQ